MSLTHVCPVTFKNSCYLRWIPFVYSPANHIELQQQQQLFLSVFGVAKRLHPHFSHSVCLLNFVLFAPTVMIWWRYRISKLSQIWLQPIAWKKRCGLQHSWLAINSSSMGNTTVMLTHRDDLTIDSFSRKTMYLMESLH